MNGAAERDPYGVSVLRAGLPYADGAESTVLAHLTGCADRSDGSDEVAAGICDWPTRYHFSPARSNLLRPLRVVRGMRVLDVGCGTGALTRWLAEQGADVTGIEGSLERARCAAVRLKGLPNARVACGTVDDLPAGDCYDLVVVVGVLEYAPVFLGDGGAERFLASVGTRLRPGGVLVLAIENQLGLKYLLGYAEDHHSLPWVGVEGYRQGRGPRTWSRARLSELLTAAGLPVQRWLMPFPDYKLPTVILDEAVYRRPDGWRLVDQLVRVPVTPEASAPSLVCDARLAHRQLLEAGLGPDVANSFLVQAARADDAAELSPADDLAWLFSDGRLRQWRRSRVLTCRGAELWVEDRHPAGAHRSMAWLSQTPEPGGRRRYESGEPLDLALRDAVRAGDLGRAAAVLKAWRRTVDAYGCSEPEPVPGLAFAPNGPAELALPGTFLDLLPANFVDTGGTVAFIDREWSAAHLLSARKVQIRALWWQAHELISNGDAHPWGPMASVDDVCRSLCAMAEIGCSLSDLTALRRDETELQHLVHGTAESDLEERLAAVAGRRSIDVTPRALDFTTLQRALDFRDRELQALDEQLRTLQRERQEVGNQLGEAQGALAASASRVDELLEMAQSVAQRAGKAEAELEASSALLTDLQSRVAQQAAELDRWTARFAALERRPPVRLYRGLQRLARRRSRPPG